MRFTEQLQFEGRQRPSESGVLTLKKQGKMRWQYAKPAGKLFISDGKEAFLYTSSDNRVEKVPLRDTEDMRAPLAFLLGHLDLKKQFRDFQTRPGEGGNWLEGFAKTERAPYEKVDMLVSLQGSIEELEITGRDRSYLTFKFSDERLNPPVEEKLFHFAMPPDAEIVDTVAIGSEDR